MLTYPDKTLLENFIKTLKKEDAFLGMHLPPINEFWHQQILSIFKQIELSYFGKSLQEKTAYLFYKIIKNHALPDGNKRSSIIALFIFIAINNGALLVQANQIERLTILVAGSKAKKHQEIISHLKWDFNWLIEIN